MRQYSIYLKWGDSYHRIVEPIEYDACIESCKGHWQEYDTQIRETRYDSNTRMVVEVKAEN